MGATRHFNLDVRSAAEAGDPLEVRNFTNKWIQVGSGFVATLQLQGRMTGGPWEQIGSNITASEAGDLISVPQMVEEVRVETTAYTSGTPAIRLGGESTHD